MGGKSLRSKRGGAVWIPGLRRPGGKESRGPAHRTQAAWRRSGREDDRNTQNTATRILISSDANMKAPPVDYTPDMRAPPMDLTPRYHSGTQANVRRCEHASTAHGSHSIHTGLAQGSHITISIPFAQKCLPPARTSIHPRC